MTKKVFAMVPEEAISDTQLTPSEFKVLVALYSFRNDNFDTCFPKLEALAARAGYSDKTQISKITTRLEAKGWLTKATKKSFHGPKKYHLMIPARLLKSGETPQVEETAQDGEPAQLGQTTQSGEANGGEVSQVGETAQVGENAPPNLEKLPNSQLGQTPQHDPEQTSREQTIQQTSSVACATAAGAASRVDNSLAGLGKAYSSENPGKAIFDLGVPWLATAGCHEERARSILGSLIKRFGQGRAFDALITAMMVTPADPPAYLLAVASKIGDEIPQDWVPPDAAMAELAGYGVPEEIIKRARDVFVIWFREQGIRHPSFSGLFVNWCRKDWERAEGNRTAYLNRLAGSAGLPQQQAWREPA